MSNIYELKELEIEEISLVDAGANPEADIILMKRDDISKRLAEVELEKAHLAEAIELNRLGVEAETLWPLLSGNKDQKAIVLKQINLMPDTVRDKVMQFLQAANAALAMMMQEQGAPLVQQSDALSDEETLHALASAYAKQHSVSLPVAKKRLVTENPQATALFKRVLSRVQKRDH